MSVLGLWALGRLEVLFRTLPYRYPIFLSFWWEDMRNSAAQHIPLLTLLARSSRKRYFLRPESQPLSPGLR